MDSVSLIATKTVPYAGRTLHVGDRFSAPPKDATLLKMIGSAADAPIEKRVLRTKVLEPPVPDANQDVAPPLKRQYRRRDLTAEP